MNEKNERYALGIDIGGTKLAVALVNQIGEITYRKEHPSNTESAESLFDTLVQCIEEVFEASGLTIAAIQGMGIGIPGKVDVKNGIAIFQNNIPWSNFPIVNRIKEVFGQSVPVYIDNDVKMAGFAEYKMAQNRPEDLFTYVTISTGIAATSLLNNQVIRGNGFSGEIGFIPLKMGDKYVSLEKYASGPAIQKAVENVESTKDVFMLADKGDQFALKMIKERAHGIAIGLYSIISILDPKAIVIGGSVGYNNPHFVEAIRKELSEFVVKEQSHILENITISELGSDNGIIGAGLRALS